MTKLQKQAANHIEKLAQEQIGFLEKLRSAKSRNDGAAIDNYYSHTVMNARGIKTWANALFDEV